jgi:hypothetical protein
MPYKVYHGKTGVVYNVAKSAVGVIIYKVVGNRSIEKRVNVRVEHIAKSRSREECKRTHVSVYTPLNNTLQSSTESSPTPNAVATPRKRASPSS